MRLNDFRKREFRSRPGNLNVVDIGRSLSLRRNRLFNANDDSVVGCRSAAAPLIAHPSILTTSVPASAGPASPASISTSASSPLSLISASTAGAETASIRSFVQDDMDIDLGRRTSLLEEVEDRLSALHLDVDRSPDHDISEGLLSVDDFHTTHYSIEESMMLFCEARRMDGRWVRASFDLYPCVVLSAQGSLKFVWPRDFDGFEDHPRSVPRLPMLEMPQTYTDEDGVERRLTTVLKLSRIDGCTCLISKTTLSDGRVARSLLNLDLYIGNCDGKLTIGGGFTQSCFNVDLIAYGPRKLSPTAFMWDDIDTNAVLLSCDAKAADGTWKRTFFDLSPYLAHHERALRWQLMGDHVPPTPEEVQHEPEIELSIHVVDGSITLLNASCQTLDGLTVKSAIALDDFIGCNSGQLALGRGFTTTCCNIQLFVRPGRCRLRRFSTLPPLPPWATSTPPPSPHSATVSPDGSHHSPSTTIPSLINGQPWLRFDPELYTRHMLAQRQAVASADPGSPQSGEYLPAYERRLTNDGESGSTPASTPTATPSTSSSNSHDGMPLISSAGGQAVNLTMGNPVSPRTDQNVNEAFAKPDMPPPPPYQP
ncbi:hypothetical protein HK102_011631 [Quaeritorhiza haematococci]|nr:hypothetical protein HK102_011631 [Quaeritorhiza haematococci]